MTRSLRIALLLLPLIGGVAVAQAPAAPPPGGSDNAAKPNSLPDQNAAQEPTAKSKPDTQPSPGIFVDGVLAVPGAAADPQTRPAKFSAANDADDKIPIMARGPQLTDDQKKLIADALRQAPKPATGAQAGVQLAPTVELPTGVEMQDWPSGLVDRVPAVRDTKFVRLAGRIMIVQPRNRIVIGEIAQ